MWFRVQETLLTPISQTVIVTSHCTGQSLGRSRPAAPRPSEWRSEPRVEREGLEAGGVLFVAAAGGMEAPRCICSVSALHVRRSGTACYHSPASPVQWCAKLLRLRGQPITGSSPEATVASDGPRTQGLAIGLDPRSPMQASLPPPGPLAAAAAASRPLAIFLSHSSVASLK